VLLPYLALHAALPRPLVGDAGAAHQTLAPRSASVHGRDRPGDQAVPTGARQNRGGHRGIQAPPGGRKRAPEAARGPTAATRATRSEEHTSELQSRENL